MASTVASFAPGNKAILLKLADFSFMMSLGISAQDTGSVLVKRVGQGKVGECHPKGHNVHIVVAMLGCKKTSVNTR